jgi:hypothetical protein
MALGFDYGSEGGDFNDIVKYDARAGRIFRVDRADGVSESVEIHNFKAVFDIAHMEVGWINFSAGSAPEFRMAPRFAPFPDRPSPAFKKGVRCMIKLNKEHGGSVREIAGNSNAILGGFDELTDDYDAQVKANPGKVPVVIIESTTPVTSGNGEKKSTNYRPKFKITAWVNRPEDLVSNWAPEKKPEPQQTQQQGKTPPETGAKKVTHETADADDFG